MNKFQIYQAQLLCHKEMNVKIIHHHENKQKIIQTHLHVVQSH